MLITRELIVLAVLCPVLLLELLLPELVFSQSAVRNSKVIVRLIDWGTGEVVTSITGRIETRTAVSTLLGGAVDDRIVVPLQGGQVESNLIGGLLYRSTLFPDNSFGGGIRDQAGNLYVIGSTVVEYQPKEQETLFVDYLVRRAPAVVNFSPLSPEGMPILEGYLELFNRDVKHYVAAQLPSDGLLQLPVIDSIEYSMRFVPAVNSNLLAPLLPPVMLSMRENRLVQPILVRPDHRVDISIVVPEDLTELVCGAESSSGTIVNGSIISLSRASISLPRSQSLWKISCRGVSTSRRYSGKVEYRMPTLNEGAVTVTLAEKGDFFPAQTVSVDSTESSIIIAPDGETTIEVPKGSIANSGNIELVISSGVGYLETLSFTSFQNFDIKFKVDGKPVVTTNEPVTLTFKVNKRQLEEAGGDVENVFPARYDEELKTWIRNDNYTYDEETQTFKVAVTHFSIWGLLVNLASELNQDKPQSLKARSVSDKTNGWKRSKLRNVALSWDHSRSDIVSGYVVQVLRVRQRTKRGKLLANPRDWSRARSFSTERNALRIKRPKGNYLIRVAVAGTIDYSDPLKLIVK